MPAEACTLSVFDSIFTRMGASDEIARGRSTFMVEMTEASEILKLATRRSLIILDELGRGTSTLDGQAIAHAVLEHIVTKIQACTCFITHYPSLAEAEKVRPSLYRVSTLVPDNHRRTIQIASRVGTWLASNERGRTGSQT